MKNENKKMYMTRTHVGHWTFTRPRSNETQSIYSAENQVSLSLLLGRGLVDDSGKMSFGKWIREYHGNIVEEAREFIGITVEVNVPKGYSYRRYREEFCDEHNNDLTNVDTTNEKDNDNFQGQFTDNFQDDKQ
jgi:hypothetical protein